MGVIMVLAGIALPLLVPFLATRAALEATVGSHPDPRTPAAARAVRRTALVCAAIIVALGTAFSAWCYNQAFHCDRGPGLDFAGILYFAGCFVPLLPVGMVLIAILLPVRVQYPVSEPHTGFSPEL